MPPVSMSDVPRTIQHAPTITLYGPAECPNCEKAMALFTRNKVAHEKITIESGDENHRHITEDLGYTQAPVIIVKFHPDDHHVDIHWGGHRIDMLTAITRLCTKGIQADAGNGAA